MEIHVRFLMVLTLSAGLLSCSSPQSQERVDTVLCWLRPSCLPSDSAPPSTDAPQTETLPNPINSVDSSETLPSPQLASSKFTGAPDCLTSAQITVTGFKPFITVSYVEPTTKANGRALANLAKTTIYHDLGKGFLKYKEIKATSPEGGGKIREKISFSLQEEETILATICVTATDTNGQES